MNQRVSLAEGAAFLGVSPHTVRDWVRQRRIAVHRLGRRVIFDLRDLEAFLKQSRIPARDERGR